jgi:hypothetical protein
MRRDLFLKMAEQRKEEAMTTHHTSRSNDTRQRSASLPAQAEPGSSLAAEHAHPAPHATSDELWQEATSLDGIIAEEDMFHLKELVPAEDNYDPDDLFFMLDEEGRIPGEPIWGSGIGEYEDNAGTLLDGVSWLQALASVMATPQAVAAAAAVNASRASWSSDAQRDDNGGGGGDEAAKDYVVRGVVLQLGDTAQVLELPMFYERALIDPNGHSVQVSSYKEGVFDQLPAEDYEIAYNPLTGGYTFSLTASGLARMTSWPEPHQQVCFKVTIDGKSYALQVVVSKDGSFSSTDQTHYDHMDATVDLWGERYCADFSLPDNGAPRAPLVITGARFNNDVVLTNASGTTLVAGSHISLGEGKNSLRVESHASLNNHFGHAMKNGHIEVGNGDNTLDFSSVYTGSYGAGGSTSYGSIDNSTIRIGNGNNAMTVTATGNEAGNARGAGILSSDILFGDGDNTLTATGSYYAIGGSHVTFGDGNNSLDLQGERVISGYYATGLPQIAPSVLTFGDGDNTLTLHAVGITGGPSIGLLGSTITMGDGDNHVHIHGGTYGLNALQIYGIPASYTASKMQFGHGDNTLIVDSSSEALVGQAVVEFGDGANSVHIRSATGSAVNGSKLILGDSDNSIVLTSVSGNAVSEGARVIAGDGDNTITISSQNGHAITGYQSVVYAGNGDNEITINGGMYDVSGFAHLAVGSGSNTITVHGNFNGSINVGSDMLDPPDAFPTFPGLQGCGNNHVWIDGAFHNYGRVFFGDGDDTLRLTGAVTSSNVGMRGGLGFDVLELARPGGGYSLNGYNITGFEHIKMANGGADTLDIVYWNLFDNGGTIDSLLNIDGVGEHPVLYIDVDANDIVKLTGTHTNVGTHVYDSVTYDVYLCHDSMTPSYGELFVLLGGDASLL